MSITSTSGYPSLRHNNHFFLSPLYPLLQNVISTNSHLATSNNPSFRHVWLFEVTDFLAVSKRRFFVEVTCRSKIFWELVSDDYWPFFKFLLKFLFSFCFHFKLYAFKWRWLERVSFVSQYESMRNLSSLLLVFNSLKNS